MRGGGIFLVLSGVAIVLAPWIVPVTSWRGVGTSAMLELNYTAIVGGLLSLAGWVLVACGTIARQLDASNKAFARRIEQLMSDFVAASQRAPTPPRPAAPPSVAPFDALTAPDRRPTAPPPRAWRTSDSGPNR